MERVQAEAGVEIILALKGFAMWSMFPLVGRYLQGCTASSVWEAKLAKETMGKQVHAYSPAYKDDDISQLIPLVEHISFNSLSQWDRYKQQCIQGGLSVGLRVNPEHQEADTPLYDPSAPGSRLGIRADQLREIQNQDLSGVDGLHIHTLCECDSYATQRTIEAIEAKFSQWLPQMKWVNLGGGHLMTKAGYDVEHLITTLRTFKDRWDIQVILEPGSAVAWQTGTLVSQVVDIVENDGNIAILDISATAHMPDVLEMPYRPEIRDAANAGEKPYEYRLGGNSCLAGDVIDTYSFDQPLQIGQRLIFEDMIHYTMVKTTFFNGVEHPSIGVLKENGEFELIKQFSYDDFKSKLS
jgi:carboxynorspermidine decarboxylase